MIVHLVHEVECRESSGETGVVLKTAVGDCGAGQLGHLDLPQAVDGSGHRTVEGESQGCHIRFQIAHVNIHCKIE